MTEGSSDGLPADRRADPATGTGARRAGRRFGPLARAACLATLGAMMLFAVGLWLFIRSVDRSAAVLPEAADGIVVLTGGPDRIGDGVELLAKRLARRMLITGVRPGVSLETLGKPMPSFKPEMACCVDLEYAAQNTVGNAVAARAWMQRNGYHSLIVVTSNFHMPRALIEFRRTMPDVALYSHPVNSERVSVENWWREGPVARLLVLEYGKFVVAWCRMQLTSLLPA
jgi:uncharacterized SAM-binding protein YcdF (DUF218 family)